MGICEKFHHQEIELTSLLKSPRMYVILNLIYVIYSRQIQFIYGSFDNTFTHPGTCLNRQ